MPDSADDRKPRGTTLRLVNVCRNTGGASQTATGLADRERERITFLIADDRPIHCLWSNSTSTGIDFAPSRPRSAFSVALMVPSSEFKLPTPA